MSIARKRVFKQIYWSSPPSQDLKFNFDATKKGEETGISFILRNE